MEHAGAAAFNALEDLFCVIRRRDGVGDRHRGYFYRKGRALAHFHQDSSRLFADLHGRPQCHRLRVSEPEEPKRFLAALDAAIEKTG